MRLINVMLLCSLDFLHVGLALGSPRCASVQASNVLDLLYEAPHCVQLDPGVSQTIIFARIACVWLTESIS